MQRHLRRLISPDGRLRFLVVEEDGDYHLGFENTPWHTHGDLLSAGSGLTTEAAIEAFVGKLVNGDLIVAIGAVDGAIRDIWITEDPVQDLRYCPEAEVIEFRRWDGSKVVP